MGPRAHGDEEEGQVEVRIAVRGKDMLGVEAAHDPGGPTTWLENLCYQRIHGC